MGKITLNFGKFTFGFSRFLQHLSKLSSEVETITFAGCRFADKSNDNLYRLSVDPSHIEQASNSNKPRGVDQGLPEFMSRCSVVELYNTRFKLNKPIKKQEFANRAVTIKVYLGAQSSIEGFEDVFNGIKYLSLEKFNADKSSYSKLPFL